MSLNTIDIMMSTLRLKQQQQQAAALRQEQDAEYQACLEQDLERDLRTNEEEQIKQLMEESYRCFIDSKRSKVGSAVSDDGVVVRFCINNTKARAITQSFSKTDTIESLYDFMLVYYYDVLNVHHDPELKLFTYDQVELTHMSTPLESFPERFVVRVTGLTA